MDNRPSHLRWGYGELVIVCLAPAFLASRLKEMRDDHFAWSKVMWDVATIASAGSTSWRATPASRTSW